MGASESTAKTNGTRDDEEKSQQESGESSMGGGMALAAWGISRMLSENTEKDGHHGMESLLAHSGHVSKGKRLERSTWSPPPFGRFKMNTDGGCRPDGYYRSNNNNADQGPSGYGGILRDHRGKWIRGFYEYLGVKDCLTAEFHGIYHGLLLLDRLGHKGAILEADSTAAVDRITPADANNRRNRSPIIDDCGIMITECERLIHKNDISVIWVPREANKCADKLASMAIEKRELGYKEIISVPDEIKSILDQESKMSQLESGESSMGGVALAAAGVAAVGIAAWGISRMLSTHPLKINTDGRCHPIRECPQEVPDDGVEIRPSGYAGILCDHDGNWVRGFRGSAGVTDSFTAELHGIHEGLKLLDKLGHKGAILESDCEAAVIWINEKDQNTSKSKIINASWNIIKDCQLLARKTSTTINHIRGKDAHQLRAHKLAGLAINEEVEYMEIEYLSQLPYEIKRLFDKDA